MNCIPPKSSLQRGVDRLQDQAQRCEVILAQLVAVNRQQARVMWLLIVAMVVLAGAEKALRFV